MPWDRLRAIELADRSVVRKSRAVAAHVTQVQPLSSDPRDAPTLHPAFLRMFDRDVELVVTSDGPEPTSLRGDFFDATYGRHDDPWGYTDRWYEERKRALTLAALPDARYGRVLEVGCGIGVLTALLAERADHLLAVDVSAAAVERARARVPGVQVEVADVAEGVPDGPFDLVVLSEVGYYLDRPTLRRVLDRPPGPARAGRHPRWPATGGTRSRRTRSAATRCTASCAGPPTSRSWPSTARPTSCSTCTATTRGRWPSGRGSHDRPHRARRGRRAGARRGAAGRPVPRPRCRLPGRRRGRCCTDLTVDLVLVLDRCTDDTRGVALGHLDVRLLDLDDGRAGAARAAGVRDALARSTDATRPARGWPAPTPTPPCPRAGSSSRCGWPTAGADVVVGTVRPDPADLSPAQLAAWRSTRVPGRPNGHVHGANLGVRADAYLRAGGFPDRPEHEDVDLVAALTAVGRAGRRDGRVRRAHLGAPGRPDPGRLRGLPALEVRARMDEAESA